MIKCPNCGKENDADAKFCENCGHELTATGLSRSQLKQKKRRYWPFIMAGIIIVLAVGIFIFMRTPNGNSNAEVADSSSSSSTASKSLNSANKESESERSTASSDSKKSVDLTETQQGEVESQMLNWADGRAKVGNMAVSDFYFDHGAAGSGDWYANTPDGEIQVQDEQNPGKNGFKIHAVGGLVFYTAKDGTTGIDDNLRGTTADGYSLNMNFNRPVSKYLFGYNGVVYELKSGNGIELSQNTGFGEYSDDGTKSGGNIEPNGTFIISNDQAAKTELQKVLAQY